MCAMVEKYDLHDEGLSGLPTSALAGNHLSLPDLRPQRELDGKHLTPETVKTPGWAANCMDLAQLAFWYVWFMFQYGAARISLHFRIGRLQWCQK